MTTLPESLVASIKKVNEGVQAFKEEVGKLNDLSSRLQVEMDQLINRPKERLENIPLSMAEPVRLPRAIEPYKTSLDKEAAE